MPRGRPKTTVAPCGYCGKRFKRMEHLVRHERTHTHEKPFACHCGQSFSRQDLLARHARLSHPTESDIPPARESVVEDPESSNAFETGLSEHDLLWDPALMSQDVLPATLFDTDFAFFDEPTSIKPAQMSNFARFSSRLPSLDDPEDGDEDPENGDEPEQATNAEAMPWSVTQPVYDKLCLEVQAHSGILPSGCSLPSRNAFMLYVETYLMCASKFLPFIHPATFSVENRDVELLLAIVAIGALYRFEYPKAYQLYFLAKSILEEKLRRESLQSATNLLSGQFHSTSDKIYDLRKMQTLILLINFASWADKSITSDALSMGSRLAILARDNGISKPDEMPEDIDWPRWVAVEERRRTLFAAYVLSNLHSLAFSVPPLILNHEIGIFLPGCTGQWEASTAAQWQELDGPPELLFFESLRSLFDETGTERHILVSSFANYLLIHGLLQQVYIGRRSMLIESLQPEFIKSSETALRNWQSSWEITTESTLDPSSPNGPLGLSATALLRLAYIRPHCHASPCRGLLTRDTQSILEKQPRPERVPHIDRAVLHAVHALSIPVRLGIGFMACSKNPIWTIEHSMCSLECALLLKKWLEMIAEIARLNGSNGLRRAEKRLLGIVAGIIRETEFAETLDLLENEASRFQRMAAIVVKLWAQIFQGVHVLEIDNAIGASLQLLADSIPD